MKIYTEYDKEVDSVTILCNLGDLKTLINALTEFELKIEKYLAVNVKKRDLGFTHMHYIDQIDKEEQNNSDIVFYVDLDQEKGD